MAKHEIEGLNELVKKLQNMGNEGKAIQKEVLQEAVQPLRKEIIKNAPEEKGELHAYSKKYGQLKDNIRVDWDETTETMWIDTGDAFWASFQEYGTKSIKKKPFMENSYRDKKDEVEKLIAESIKKRLGLS